MKSVLDYRYSTGHLCNKAGHWLKCDFKNNNRNCNFLPLCEWRFFFRLCLLSNAFFLLKLKKDRKDFNQVKKQKRYEISGHFFQSLQNQKKKKRKNERNLYLLIECSKNLDVESVQQKFEGFFQCTASEKVCGHCHAIIFG